MFDELSKVDYSRFYCINLHCSVTSVQYFHVHYNNQYREDLFRLSNVNLRQRYCSVKDVQFLRVHLHKQYREDLLRRFYTNSRHRHCSVKVCSGLMSTLTSYSERTYSIVITYYHVSAIVQ